jgi:phage major head subunit gpT-like protein
VDVSVRTSDRIIVQIGIGLGAIPGAVIETVSDAVLAQIDAAFSQLIGDGGVILSADHTNVTVAPPSAAWTAAQLAQQQAAADDLTARTAVASLVQSTVGITWQNLTAAQKQALIVALLYRAGALDKNLTVQPLAGWLKR